MSEEKKTVELKDEELENVTGGDEANLRPYKRNPQNLVGKTIQYMYELCANFRTRYTGIVTSVSINTPYIFTEYDIFVVVDGRTIPFVDITYVYYD